MSNSDAKKQFGSPGHGSTSESTRPDSQIPTKRMRQDEPSTSSGSQDRSEQAEGYRQGKIVWTYEMLNLAVNMYA